MARKKAGKKPMPATAEVETKPVRLDLSPEVHRLLRIVAADEDMSMASYARRYLEVHLREEAKRRGLKP
jgi:predicted HicB family RNase H-like nuclease